MHIDNSEISFLSISSLNATENQSQLKTAIRDKKSNPKQMEKTEVGVMAMNSQI